MEALASGVDGASERMALTVGPTDLPTGLVRHQGPMAQLVADTLAVNVRHFETTTGAELWPLVPTTAALVEAACGLVASIVEDCMAETASETRDRRESFLPFELAVDAVVEQGGSSTSAIEDIAFLVMLELRQRRERVRVLTETTDPVVLLGECDGALRRIRKGLGAIDAVLARVKSVPHRLDFSSELEQSLLVRRTYAKFRRRVAATGAPSVGELKARMRAAGTSIAVLVGWDAFPLLRVRDRLQLRLLQRRILEWLRPAPENDDVAGLRLWQDLAGFVDMLGLVSRRQELIEHDATLLATIVERLGTDASEAELVRTLGPLSGRDDELDAWLAAPSPRSMSTLRAVVTRVHGDVLTATGGTR